MEEQACKFFNVTGEREEISFEAESS